MFLLQALDAGFLFMVSPGKIHFVIIFLLCGGALFAGDDGVEGIELGEGSQVKTLLAGYLENDSELKELMLDFQKAELELGKTKVNTGLAINLTSGTMNLDFNDAVSFSAGPELTLEAPALNGSKLTVSFPVFFDGKGNRAEDAGVDLSIGLLSDARDLRNITLLESNRDLTEAKRAVERRSREAESAFYTELRALYQTQLDVFSLTDDLITDELEFDGVKAQNYPPTSPAYRTAELKTRNARREVAEAERLLQDNLNIFSRNCGIKVDALPSGLPKIAPADLPDAGALKIENIRTIESAEWTHYIEKLRRDKTRNFTLSLDTGLNFDKIDFGGANDIENEVSGGLTLKKDGLSFSLGSYMTLQNGKKPGISFSFGITPQDFKLKKLNDAEKKLDEQRELLNIATARKEWDDLVSSLKAKRLDLGWLYTERQEQYELDSELEAQMRDWRERGVVSETEYRGAALNKETSRVNFLLNVIDMLIYKTDLSLYSIDDETGGGENGGGTENSVSGGETGSGGNGGGGAND